MLSLKKTLTAILKYSYMMRYKAGTAIPSGADFDNYKTPGVYFVLSASTAQGISNIPSAVGGRLEVIDILPRNDSTAASERRLMQTYIANSANVAIFRRIWTGSWGAWKRMTVE